MDTFWQGFVSGACAAVAGYLVVAAGALALLHHWMPPSGAADSER